MGNEDSAAQMLENWPKEIADAQRKLRIRVSGREYERIRYGDEAMARRSPKKPECPGCSVHKGQLHVPRCYVEQCAACGDESLCCDCIDDYVDAQA
jgi:hypothetical protein